MSASPYLLVAIPPTLAALGSLVVLMVQMNLSRRVTEHMDNEESELWPAVIELAKDVGEIKAHLGLGQNAPL